MKALRSIFRRKLRAFLTIFGITIGVFALVVMGSMAEKINLLVDGGVRYFTDKVIVAEGSSQSMWMTNPLSVQKGREIEAVEGVAAASATVGMMLEKEQSGITMGMPATITGSDLRGEEYETFKITYSSGRQLKPEDRHKIVVGSDLVQKLGAEVGEQIMIRGEPFEVVGIMEKTLTAPDTTVVMSLADAQRLFHKDLPEVLKEQITPDNLSTSITVYVRPGYNPERVAAEIQRLVPGVKAFSPKAFQDQVASGTRIFNVIIFGIALVSLLVGGLSVVNTMTMSVHERTREIGIRKAIGASDGQVVRQFLSESALIGLLGGLSGLVLGWLVTVVANAAGNESGTAIFLLTARLAIGSVLFSLFLGVVSGLYPSWHAARLHPVVALRYE